MSAKSKKSLPVEPIDRPFPREILRRAGELAGHYQVVLWHEDGKYFGRGLEYPEAMGDGKDPDACVESVHRAMIAGVATTLEMGETPPSPASESARTRQVNIRVSDEEKLRIESAARQKGFKGISDYVRAKALEI